MTAIHKKPEMSEFEKGVVHGMSLAEAEAEESEESLNPIGMFITILVVSFSLVFTVVSAAALALTMFAI